MISSVSRVVPDQVLNRPEPLSEAEILRQVPATPFAFLRFIAGKHFGDFILWRRDHVYSVEWTDGQLVYSVNDAQIGRIAVGTMAHLDPPNAPANLATFL